VFGYIQRRRAGLGYAESLIYKSKIDGLGMVSFRNTIIMDAL
jgi:hypothetical protein